MFFVAVVAIFVLICIFYLSSWKSDASQHIGIIGKHVTNPKPPFAVSKIPWLEHTAVFASGGFKLASTLRTYCGTRTPITFKLLRKRMILISSPDNIRAVLFNSDLFTTHDVRTVFMRQVLGISPQAIAAIEADTSGTSNHPLPGSNVPPHRRILRMQQENTFGAISKSGVREILPRYIHNFEESLRARAIGDHWVEVSDLLLFIRDLAIEGSVTTLCGASFLEQSPGFGDALWTFDANLHYLYVGLPKFMRPAAANAREKCLESITRWRRSAIQKSKNREGFDELDMWDDVWGSKIMRCRNEMYDKFPEWDERSRAAADLGVLWAANDNLPPITYWFLLAILRDESVRQRCVIEMRKSQLSETQEVGSLQFDPSLLIKQPFLQSLLHEVLRTEVSIFISRSVAQESVVGNYTLPKGATAIVATQVEHMDKTRWESRQSASGGILHPVEEFWPERFLEHSNDSVEPTFCLKGLEGTFIPFGIGSNMCPGRHFAMRATMYVSALLLFNFDIELKDVEKWADITRDYGPFGYSTLRNRKQTAFRIRRKGIIA